MGLLNRGFANVIQMTNEYPLLFMSDNMHTQARSWKILCNIKSGWETRSKALSSLSFVFLSCQIPQFLFYLQLNKNVFKHTKKICWYNRCEILPLCCFAVSFPHVSSAVLLGVLKNNSDLNSSSHCYSILFMVLNLEQIVIWSKSVQFGASL